MLKVARRIVGSLIVLYLALWGLTVYIHYPNPIDSIRLGLAEPSETGKLMPAEAVLTSSPIALEQQVAADGSFNTAFDVVFEGETISTLDFFEKTRTNAFLVLKDGKLVMELYFNGTEPKTQLPSYSVAKSVVSILAGQLVEEGAIAESDTFVSFFPEYQNGTAFDDITVGQLLDMASGIAVADNYPTGPEGWGAPIAQMYATNDIPNFVMNHRDLYWEPGTANEYRSIDTQLMGMIIEKVTGKNLAEVLTNGTSKHPGLWNSLQAEFDGTWNSDHQGGTVKGFCCLNIAARDYAKLGQALLDAKQGRDTSVISAAWADRMFSPVTNLDYGWGYGAFTWHPFEGTSLYLGLHGQFVYIDPATETVIVKLSDNKTDALSEPTAEVLKQVATHFNN